MTRRQRRSWERKQYHRMRRYRDERAKVKRQERALIVAVLDDFRLYHIDHGFSLEVYSRVKY